LDGNDEGALCKYGKAIALCSQQRLPAPQYEQPVNGESVQSATAERRSGANVPTPSECIGGANAAAQTKAANVPRSQDLR
jgi:hypothetical protein